MLKSNQEYIQLHDVPQGFELDLGDMVWVDEFNRYIDLVKVEQQYMPVDTIAKKMLDRGHKVKLTTQKNTSKKIRTCSLSVISAFQSVTKATSVS